MTSPTTNGDWTGWASSAPIDASSSALDTVLIGRAIALAKKRCMKEGKSFTEWKTKYRFSNASVSRYMRLAKDCEDKDKCEHFKTIGPLEAYIEAGIEAPREHKPRQSSVKSQATTKPMAGKEEASKPPSWAAPDDSPDSVTSQDEPDQFLELWSVKQCLEQELRKALPWVVAQFKERVLLLLTKDTEVLRAAWPEEESERKRIAADIDALIESLRQLVTTLERGGSAAGSKNKGRQRPAA